MLPVSKIRRNVLVLYVVPLNIQILNLITYTTHIQTLNKPSYLDIMSLFKYFSLQNWSVGRKHIRNLFRYLFWYFQRLHHYNSITIVLQRYRYLVIDSLNTFPYTVVMWQLPYTVNWTPPCNITCNVYVKRLYSCCIQGPKIAYITLKSSLQSQASDWLKWRPVAK